MGGPRMSMIPIVRTAANQATRFGDFAAAASPAKTNANPATRARSIQSLSRRFMNPALHNQHRVSVTVEPIPLTDRLGIGRADQIDPGQGATRTSRLLRGRWKLVSRASRP